MCPLSNSCHFFHRLGARAGGAAAGVPGCGGGAEGPFSEQTARLPARAAGSQVSHVAGRWQRSGRLWLQWVTTRRRRRCDYARRSPLVKSFKTKGKRTVIYCGLLCEETPRPRGFEFSYFISPNKCVLVLLICMKWRPHEDTSYTFAHDNGSVLE